MTNLKISRELVVLLTLTFAVLAIGIYKRPALALTTTVPVTHQDSIRELASMPDVAQARDSTVPVFVFRVVSGFTEPDEGGIKRIPSQGSNRGKSLYTGCFGCHTSLEVDPASG